MTTEVASINVLTADVLLQNWQGHRRLTRRTIEAFPDDKLFQFSIGGIRPFGELANEFLGIAVATVDGVATGKWREFTFTKSETKADVLAMWDIQTSQLNEKFPLIPPSRFSQLDKAFGQWEMSGLAVIQYAIDNEIHHRGQGYVYLRALGIEPPPFWERD